MSIHSLYLYGWTSNYRCKLSSWLISKLCRSGFLYSQWLHIPAGFPHNYLILSCLKMHRSFLGAQKNLILSHPWHFEVAVERDAHEDTMLEAKGGGTKKTKQTWSHMQPVACSKAALSSGDSWVVPSGFNNNVPHQRDEANTEKRMFGFVQHLVFTNLYGNQHLWNVKLMLLMQLTNLHLYCR